MPHGGSGTRPPRCTPRCTRHQRIGRQDRGGRCPAAASVRPSGDAEIDAGHWPAALNPNLFGRTVSQLLRRRPGIHVRSSPAGMSESRAEYDAVIVGSGFGGAVAACRLAQAGRNVLVLERGRRWNISDYPRQIGDAGCTTQDSRTAVTAGSSFDYSADEWWWSPGQGLGAAHCSTRTCRSTPHPPYSTPDGRPPSILQPWNRITGKSQTCSNPDRFPMVSTLADLS